MGAKKQIYTAELTYQGQGKRGTIIIRAQAVQQTNEVIKMGINWRNINTGVPGCMGMCPTPSPFHLEILKEVPDTGSFVVAMRHPANYLATQREVTITSQVHSLAQICDGN